MNDIVGDDRGGSRVLVTGGAGFLGSHLCEALLDRGDSVVALDNFATGRTKNVSHLLSNPRFELVTHDVREPYSGTFGLIFHLACPASPAFYEKDPLGTATVNFLGALNMLRLAEANGATVLLASTSEVYGDPEQHPQPESYLGRVNPIGPRACHDEGKRIAETLFFDYARTRGVHGKVVRIFNTYGPRMDPHGGTVVTNFVVQALLGKDLTIYGDGSQTRSFCYVDDLTRGLLAMSAGPRLFAGPVNLGNPEEWSIRRLAEEVLAITGAHGKLVFEAPRGGDPGRRSPDITLARETLGWQPTVGLRDGLERTVAHVRDELAVLKNPVERPPPAVPVWEPLDQLAAHRLPGAAAGIPQSAPLLAIGPAGAAVANAQPDDAERGRLAAEFDRLRRERDKLSDSLARTEQDRARSVRELKRVSTEADRLRVRLGRMSYRMQEIRNSFSYRVTGPIRIFERAARSLHKRSFKENMKKVADDLRAKPPAGTKPQAYAEWTAAHAVLTADDRTQILNHIAALDRQPTISVLMPTYNTPDRLLQEAIESVMAQLYPNWELCIADDASTSNRVRAILEGYAARDKRIKLRRRGKRGGISVASNSALELASGEWTALLDHDDLIAEHALYLVALETIAHPDAEIIFSDEDTIDGQGRPIEAYFKSDWNPDLMLGQNGVSHLGVFRTATLRSIGGFREGLEGSQDWDVALRVAGRARPDQIRHIPWVLYHWRQPRGGMTFSQQRLGEATQAAKRAVREHLAAHGVDAELQSLRASSWQRVIRRLPQPAPSVTMVIPTRDRVDLLSRCVDGLLQRTDYGDFDVVIVDNASSDPETLAYFADVARDSRVTVEPFPGEFDYPKIHNAIVPKARGSIVVLLNNDIDVIHGDWLAEMVSHAIRPEVGAVGAKLLYPSETIQHGGVVLGLGGVASHAHRGFPRDARGYFGRAAVTQNFSAVTGACIAFRREIYAAIGGMNPRLRISFNDIDFCLRLRQAGYLIVWTPFAQLYHLESASRGPPGPEFAAESELMRSTWGPVLDADPYYNPNLTMHQEDFGLSNNPRTTKPWKLRQWER